VTGHIKGTLGPDAVVSAQRGGTIVALLPGDRETVARKAGQLVERFDDTPVPLNGHGASAPVTLACGVIAFPLSGPPVASSMPEPMLEAEATATAGG
jgi:hypothetical protein